MIEVKQSNNEKNGNFEAFIDGKHAGLMTYTWAGEERFIIDHTEVEEAYNGKGVGKEMLLAAVDFARKNGKTAVSFCKSYFPETRGASGCAGKSDTSLE